MLAHMEHTVEFSHVRFTKIKSGLTFIINFKLRSTVMESGTTVLVFLTPDETHGKKRKTFPWLSCQILRDQITTKLLDFSSPCPPKRAVTGEILRSGGKKND